MSDPIGGGVYRVNQGSVNKTAKQMCNNNFISFII